jgi:hypothetical protein
MAVVRGEGPFADAVRRALEYVQGRGVDLSGVEVEVVPDHSITDFGAYTEHLGGLKFRIRYSPRYAGDPVLAAHEAGHVAYWTWQSKKSGGVRYVPDIDELLAEALGAVTARKLFGVPVTFKGAPLNLTQILPQRFTYITDTVDGKPIAIKVPEFGDYMSRYRAGIFLSPYFYNVTNWSHVFGNFTAMPGDVIKTVHKAWKEGAVEVVPGWGAVWRTTPTWSWPDTSVNKNIDDVSTQQIPSDVPPSNISVTSQVNSNMQKNITVNDTASSQSDVQKAVVYAQPSADAPLPPSNVQPPKYFSSDITPKYIGVPEWSNYISGRRVLVVFRNWPSLDTTTLKDTRKDYVAGAGVVSGGSLRFEGKIPVPRVVDPNAWIELVDEKTGKVLARLRSDELYRLANEGAPVTLYWSHVAVEERWPGWERFVERARELDEKLGMWRQSGAVVVNPSGTANVVRTTNAIINPDSTVSAVKVANAPTEYVPPKVPDDVRRQFEKLLSDLKKLGEGVNLKNVGEVHDRFVEMRDKTLDVVRAYPQLIDESNKVIGDVGSRIREVSSKLYDALAKAAGRDSFWRGDGDVKTPIGVYKYDPATGAFLLSLYDRPMAENIVGYIKDDGAPVVVKKTQNMSEALEEYNRLVKRKSTEQAIQTDAQQSGGGWQDAHEIGGAPNPLNTLAKVPVTGPALQTAKLLSQAQSSQQTDFLQPLHGALTKMPVVGPVLRTARPLLQTSGGSRTGAGLHSERTPVVQTQPVSAQPTTQPDRQRDFLWPVHSAVNFLTDALKAGAGIKLAALGGAKPSPAGGYLSSPGQPGGGEFIQLRTAGGFMPPPVPAAQAVYDRRRDVPAPAGEFIQQLGKQQKTGEFVAVKPPDYVAAENEARRSPVRPLDYVFIEMKGLSSAEPSGQPDRASAGEAARRTETQDVTSNTSLQAHSGYRPVDYVVVQQSSSSPPPTSVSILSPHSAQLTETSQTQESSSSKRYRGRPVAVAI